MNLEDFNDNNYFHSKFNAFKAGPIVCFISTYGRRILVFFRKLLSNINIIVKNNIVHGVLFG